MADERRAVVEAGIHPLHAFLLAGCVPLFLGALLADWAYSSTYEVQWTNFASWLLVGAMVLAGFALLWALIDLLRADRSWRGRPLIYFLVLLAAFILGFINALVHAKDAWAKMPEALILSVIVAILVLIACWLGLSTWRSGEVK
jgi:uncharacterized membrane protein